MEVDSFGIKCLLQHNWTELKSKTNRRKVKSKNGRIQNGVYSGKERPPEREKMVKQRQGVLKLQWHWRLAWRRLARFQTESMVSG